jgi:hypothetical protein
MAMWERGLRRRFQHVTPFSYLDDRVLLSRYIAGLDASIRWTCRWDAALHAELNVHKSTWTPLGAAGRRAAKNLNGDAMLGIPPAAGGKILHLGAQHTYGARMPRDHSAKRVATALDRLRSARFLPAVTRGPSAADAVATLYPAGGNHYTVQQLRQVRVQVCRTLLGSRRERQGMHAPEACLLLTAPGLHQLDPQTAVAYAVVCQARRTLATPEARAAWEAVWPRRQHHAAGPLHMLHSSLCRQGWSWDAAFSVRDRRGREHSLTAGSPETRHDLREALRIDTCEDLARRRPRDFGGLQHGFARCAARDSFSKPGGPTLHTGGIWHRRRLYRAGLASSDSCHVCGSADADTAHIMWDCTLRQPQREQLFHVHPELAHFVRQAPPATRHCGLLPPDHRLSRQQTDALLQYMRDTCSAFGRDLHRAADLGRRPHA